jgi:integrase
VLLSQVFREWLVNVETAVALGQLKRSTARSYRSVVTHDLLPAFGRIQSDRLSPIHVNAWRAAAATRITAAELAPKSFNNACGVLSACLEWAREQRYLTTNPLPRKLRAKRSPRTRLIVQGAEIKRLWQTATGQDQIIIGLALFCGLRKGEVFGAHWRDVTWPKRGRRATIHVARALVQRQLVTPKTAASDRLVLLPARLIDLLREHERTRGPVPLEDGADYIVRQDDGQPIDPDNWAKEVWPTIRAAAKLPAAVTLHGLRHTFGSLLLADNVPVKHVSEQMGHGSVAFTMDIYQHILKATSATATRALDKHIPEDRPRLRLVKRSA